MRGGKNGAESVDNPGKAGGAPIPLVSSAPPAPACWANPPWQGESVSDLPTPAKSTLTCPCASVLDPQLHKRYLGKVSGSHLAASYRPCP